MYYVTSVFQFATKSSLIHQFINTSVPIIVRCKSAPCDDVTHLLAFCLKFELSHDCYL